MDDLITFFGARLDEAAASTRKLLAYAQQNALMLQDPRYLGRSVPGWHDWPDVEQMCAERLDEIEAKRRILGEFSYEGQETRAVMRLVQVYADHPGFRDEWRV